MIVASCDSNNENSQEKVSCIEYPDYNYRYNWIYGPLCPSDTCQKYVLIWKALFMEKNNLSPQYFKDHIIVCSSGNNVWNEGISFSICYKIKIDWAVAYNCDQFVIKINKGNTRYPALDLPKDTLLAKEDIRLALDHRAYSSSILLLSNNDTLKFDSKEEAMGDLINTSGLNTLCFSEIDVDGVTGHMVLYAGAQYENKFNSCVQGSLDLMDGKTTFTDSPCYYTLNSYSENNN